MLNTIVATLLVWGVIRFLERGNESGVDGFVALTFVLAPAGLIWIIAIFLPPAKWSQTLALALTLLYFAIPALIIRTGFSYGWGRTLAYSAVVFSTKLLVGIGFYFLFNSPAAT